MLLGLGFWLAVGTEVLGTGDANFAANIRGTLSMRDTANHDADIGESLEVSSRH